MPVRHERSDSILVRLCFLYDSMLLSSAFRIGSTTFLQWINVCYMTTSPYFDVNNICMLREMRVLSLASMNIAIGVSAGCLGFLQGRGLSSAFTAEPLLTMFSSTWICF